MDATEEASGFGPVSYRGNDKLVGSKPYKNKNTIKWAKKSIAALHPKASKFQGKCQQKNVYHF